MDCKLSGLRTKNSLWILVGSLCPSPNVCTHSNLETSLSPRRLVKLFCCPEIGDMSLALNHHLCQNDQYYIQITPDLLTSAAMSFTLVPGRLYMIAFANIKNTSRLK